MATEIAAGYILGSGMRPLALVPNAAITMGRDKSNSIHVEDVMASRRHAVVQWTASGKVSVTDLGSSNGTFLNDGKLAKNVATELRNGDTIRIGGRLYNYISASGSTDTHQRANQNIEKMSEAATYVAIDANAVRAAAEAVAAGGLPDNSVSMKTGQHAPLGNTAPTVINDDQTMAGSLSIQGVVQLLQFIDSGQKTGELTVQGKAYSGYLAFNKGHVFFAEAGDKTGFDALYALACELEGKFVLKGLLQPPAKTLNIVAPTMMSMLECCRRMDDQKRT